MEPVTREDVINYYSAVIAATGETPNKWAKRARTSATNVTRLIDKKEDASPPRADTLRKLIEAAHKDAPEAPMKLRAYAGLLEEAEEDHAADLVGQIRVERFDMSISAGIGSFIGETGEVGSDPLDTLHFPRVWIRQITGSASRSIIIMKVADDEMSPTLAAGDWVFVDLNEDAPVSGEIHLLSLNKSLRFGRIHGDGTHGSTVLFLDKAAQPVIVTEELKLEVHGHVCGIAGRGL